MKILKISFIIMIGFLFVSCGFQLVKSTPKPKAQAVVTDEDSGIMVKTPIVTITAKVKSAKKAIKEMTGDWGPPEKRSQMFPLTFVDDSGTMRTILVETERYYFHSSNTHYTVVVVYNEQIIYKESIEKVIIYKNK